MARTPLSEEEKATRAAEKAAQMATRKKYNKTSEAPASMETEQNTNSNNSTGNTNEPAANSMPAGEEKTTQPAQEVKTDQKTETGPGANYQPDTTFSPMGGNKVNRTYSKPQVNQALANTIIEEPVITTETLSAEKTKEMLTNPAPGTKKEPILPPAEGFNELSPNEQKLAAEKTTDLILGAYDRLHWLGRKFVSVDMDDLADEHRRGELNMNYEAFENEDDPEKGITIKEYFEDFNKQVEEEFVVTDEFKTAVRPPLERVCMKRGWGASDEVFLAFKFGEDIAMKTGILIGFKKLTNKYMTEFRDDHAKIKQRVAVQLKQEREAQERQAAREAEIKRKASEDAERANAEKKETPALEKTDTPT